MRELAFLIIQHEHHDGVFPSLFGGKGERRKRKEAAIQKPLSNLSYQTATLWKFFLAITPHTSQKLNGACPKPRGNHQAEEKIRDTLYSTIPHKSPSRAANPPPPFFFSLRMPPLRPPL